MVYEHDIYNCENAVYIRPDSPTGFICRSMMCSRCGKCTGNNTQGHWWALCKNGGIKEHHFCCPGDCELEND